MAATAMAVGALLMGCSNDAEPVEASPEYAAWLESLATRLSPTVLKLRNEECLDSARLGAPWEHDDYDNQSFGVQAPGRTIGIKPYERPGFDRSFEGRPHDGKVHVAVMGWRSDRSQFTPWHVPPERVDGNVAQGLLTKIELWREPEGMTAYKGIGTDSFYYFDDRRVTQCRDYGSKPSLISCWVVSRDEQYRYAVELDGSERDRLPQTLKKISQAVEAMRGACPSAAVDEKQ